MVRRKYIHELPDWPDLHWSPQRLTGLLARVRHRQGRLVGNMEALGFDLRQEAVLRTLTADVVKSSEIEGETLDANQVRSSIARRLGIDAGGIRTTDRHVEGVVEMMLDATRHYDQPLSDERLFSWHAALFPTGRSGLRRIDVGRWRRGPLEAVSGPVGRPRVHFEAVAARRVAGEMKTFLHWFERDSRADQVLKAALAHFRFVTIHPFDDGNGRIARAIADLALARSENSSQRFYSMSAQIQQERSDYYGILEATQKGGLDVTGWMEWFLGCLARAIEGAQVTVASILDKARFWQRLHGMPLNERQTLVLNRLLDGFEGRLTTSKYAGLAKVSQDTALRDILQLTELGILIRGPGGGRSTGYTLAPAPSTP